MRVLGLREYPEWAEVGLAYIKSKWANAQSQPLYDDCIAHSLTTPSPLPRWFVLEDGGQVVGCAGLITNDFVSRMDLYPWLCGLFVEEDFRGQALGRLLMERVRQEAAQAGFGKIYLVTDHIGYYERYGFAYVGTGYHPCGETSRIYEGSAGKPLQHAKGGQLWPSADS